MNVKKRKAPIYSGIAVMLVLSAVLSCNPAFSKTDFSFFEPISTTPVKPVKLINPLYLDTSRTIKPVIKIVTPYNPYDEDSDKDADYFTSEINDPPPSEEILTETNETQSDKSRKNYQAEEPANEFFAPPSSVVEKEIIENKSFAENNDENIYAANVNSGEQLDLNGKIISHIYFGQRKCHWINRYSKRNYIWRDLRFLSKYNVFWC